VVNLKFNDWKEYKFGNALVVNLKFNDWKEYKFGNALVVKIRKVSLVGLFLFQPLVLST